MANSVEDEKRINTIRFLAVDAVQKANSGHPGLPLGAAGVAYTLWTRHLRHDPKDDRWFNRDRFVLSAGHGSALLYALLALYGYLTVDDLKQFRQMGSKTPGHPEYHHTSGVEVTTGPLGQGLANAVGLAMAEAHLGAIYNTATPIVDHYTYCMASDGDMMEGITSEACSLAGHLKLGKLIVFYDDNDTTLAAGTEVTFSEDVLKRYDAYGWHTIYVDEADGSNVVAIDKAIVEAKAVTDRPTLIITRTHLGLGSPLQDTFKAHGEPLGPENVAKTKEKLGWPVDSNFLIPDDVQAYFNDLVKKGGTLHDEWNARYAEWKTKNAELAAQFERARDGKLPASIAWPSITAENGDNIATREAGGLVMNAIAKDLPELVGGSADLDPSTKTYLKGFGDFEPGTYAGRNIHYGIREHAMVAASNGIALHGGLLPFSATFFNFVDYCKPSVRLAALNEIREIFIFTHDSVFLGEDGPTHQPVEQLAMLRATPNVMVVRPADALETLEAWKLAIQPKSGPWALILSRQKLPFLGVRNADVARGAYVLHESEGGFDIIMIATGSEVSLAVAAAKILEGKGTKVRVVSMPCWELFDKQDDGYRESILPRNVAARVSIEAGATLGWAKYAGDRGITIGIDHFGTSAPAKAIAEAYGFTPERVAETASGLLAGV